VEKQPLVVKLDLWRRGPSMTRNRAIYPSFIIAESDPLPWFQLYHSQIILENYGDSVKSVRVIESRGDTSRPDRDFGALETFMRRQAGKGHFTGAPDKDGLRVQVIYRPISELVPDPKNPRVHSPRQIRQIMRSIETFGFNVPILIDADNKVIAGHGRLTACAQLGLTEVPTICLEHLTAAQAKAFTIADNRLTENSVWDDRFLAEQLRDLSVVDLDFNLEVTGFEMGEIDLRIEGLSSEVEEKAVSQDESSKPVPGPSVTRPGDMWLLGDHRVHCASALEDGAYTALMRGEQAHAVFIDPPYNLRIEGNVSGLGAVKHRDFAMAYGEMSQDQFTTFLMNVCSLHARHSVDGALHFVCMDWRHLAELLAAGRAIYSELKNICVWVKNAPGMGSLYRSQHELILVFRHGRGSHRNNVQLGRYGRNRSNVWHYPNANSFSRSSDEGHLLSLHPTVKPALLVADAIMDCTARRDILLDGFLGSGTSVIAAERTGRRCYGLELDPLYVDTVVRRWQAFTRERAFHAVTGKYFDELEAAAKRDEQEGRQLRSRLPEAAATNPVQERSLRKP
jgi:DNA modification methylase